MLGKSTCVGTASTMVLPVRVRSSWLAYWVIITTTAFCLRAVTSQLREPLREVGVVEGFPCLVDDDDGGLAVLDHPLDPAEEVGQDRHAFPLALGIEDAGQVEPRDVAVDAEAVLVLAPKIQP